jgi:hypothetical protein
MTFTSTRRPTLQQLIGAGFGLVARAGAQTIANASPTYRHILIPAGAHSAVRSAALLIAKGLGLEESAIGIAHTGAVPKAGEIALLSQPLPPHHRSWVGPQAPAPKFDGYFVAFCNGAALACGNRPRSLLYAAGDLALWRRRSDGFYLRAPAFELRTSHGTPGKSIAEVVSLVGANLMQGVPAVATLKDSFPNVFRLLSPAGQDRLLHAQSEAQARCKALLQECRDADVPVYTSIYGNNFQHWSPALYDAVIQAYPSAKGVPQPHSWERAPLCPSDPMTWKIIDAYIRELMEQSGADGFLATFWDQ